jgi:hypothetical protein
MRNATYLIVGLAAVALAMLAAQAALAGLTLTSVSAVDPENEPGLLRYEYAYTNESATDFTVAITLSTALAEDGGGPEGEAWRFVIAAGDETRPEFALWFTGQNGRRIPPGGSVHGLFVLSRAKVAPTQWAALLRVVLHSRDGQAMQLGDVLGPTGQNRVKQAVPPPLLTEGWNWISFPLVPRGEVGGFDPAKVLGQQGARLNLVRYHPIFKTFQCYPDDFQETYVGQGYELWVRGERLEPNYFGLAVPPNFEIPIPAAGWSLVGCPRNSPLPLAAVSVRNEETGQVRTAMQDMGSETPWLNWNWMLWDSVEHQPQILRPDQEGDDFALRPWLGYWMWSLRGNLTLIVP